MTLNGENIDDDDAKAKMRKSYSYPDIEDEEFQGKIYKKREFYANKIEERPDLTNYNEIKSYRDRVCGKSTRMLFPHQTMLSNFINPDTPYTSLLVQHGLGTGKCVHPDTIVVINGFHHSIRHIWKKYASVVAEDNEGGEWTFPNDDLYIQSMVIGSQNSHELDLKPIKRLYREKINSYMRKILLDTGQEITITFIHKLYTDHGWQNELYVNDNVAVVEYDKLIWAKIVEIVEVKYDSYVYDFEIEETHNYVANNIVCHNTCAGVAIAEKFKPMVQKYGTKIYILVSGPLIKENWKNSIIDCTGETYYSNIVVNKTGDIYLDEAEKQKNKKLAINNALQYYRFMSYRSFYKRVLGEKIKEKEVVKGSKIHVSYRKTDEGEFERDIAVDRIISLNNTIILVDEAHNLTGNAYGAALSQVIKNSTNLRIVLFTATPMKNLADDIVSLLNFLRPHDSPIERDKIFTNLKNHQMEIKAGGMEYLKKMAMGYVSHVRGGDPLIFAKRVDRGEKPNDFKFTLVTRCKMRDFQRIAYEQAVENQDDALDKKSESVANFVFPVLDDKKELIGAYGKDGITLLKNQLKLHHDLINSKIATDILGIKDDKKMEWIYLHNDGKTLTGSIMKIPYLKYFSVKFYKAFKKINRLVWGKKGPRNVFVYSNLVKVGVEIFEQILIQNGYLAYQENEIYQIQSDTVCYFCGRHNKDHNTNLEKKVYDMSDSSTDYDGYHPLKKDKYIKEFPDHKFHPATFLSVTGKSGDESGDVIPEEKKRILDYVFNTTENMDGRHIKIILGSKVMNEGLNLHNISEVHLLDVYFNLGRVDQVVGRGIRSCSHYEMMSESYKFPFVNVYKYVVSTKNGLTTEEDLYLKAEQKHMLIKKIERGLKEVAIDCPLNISGNMFKEEIEQYEKCGEKGEPECPAICDYKKCDYKCDDKKLNLEYYDPTRKIYKNISKNKLDYSTFNNSLARNEIDFAKNKIKELYLKKYEYSLKEIVQHIKKSYSGEKLELFDDFFVYKALDELIPISENDFINFKDVVIDKFNRQGYLLYVGSNYIFQPVDQNEDIPMYYRTSFNKDITQKVSLYNYLKNTIKYQDKKEEVEEETDYDIDAATGYNFDGTMEYYNNRDEFKYVGIVDKEQSRKRTKSSENGDVFKIREKRPKILDKRRQIGLFSLFGSVCATSKEKEYLLNVAKELGIKIGNKSVRTSLCDSIRDEMLFREKYSTGKDKKTYVMIPIGHPTFRFPYNLEDYVDKIKEKIVGEFKFKTNVIVDEKKVDGHPVYNVTIKSDSRFDNKLDFMKEIGAIKQKNGDWLIIVD
jgi:DNA polymerase III delta prime subunit